MSAVLSDEQIDSVVSDLELLKDIRRALREMRDAELADDERLTLAISSRSGIKDEPICFVHGHSQWLANVALQAMEREVRARLSSKGIEVEA